MVGFELAIDFSLKTMAAARDASPKNLKPVLEIYGNALDVDRIAIASIRGKKCYFFVGIGPELPEAAGVWLNDISEDDITCLAETGFLRKPTEGVGWDILIAIHGGETGELRGVFLVDDTRDAREFDKQDEQQLIRSANLISWISGYDQEYKGMRDMAVKDGLTGLGTRRYAEERMGEIYALAYRKKIPFFVIIIDIDHFKKVNDTHGHPMGDRVLKTFASEASRFIRKEEFLARWGGEEFLICGFGTLADAHVVAERLREYVADKSNDWLDCVPITISLGISEYDHKIDEGIDTVIIRADDALYEAKGPGGRDTVRPKIASDMSL